MTNGRERRRLLRLGVNEGKGREDEVAKTQVLQISTTLDAALSAWETLFIHREQGHGEIESA